ncbi:MAG: hypothetical protein CO093_06230 [Alphaproteobacteria bacterium CG_4_9_14_3_um_filter_47_13]|nr:MAG: hypothetical protein CO093_06230 [Alphaproteobacteria bacterium CG_4_9_14_3_um_filter_47_13]
MDITPLIRADRQIIQSYNTGKFRISGTIYESAVIVFPDRVENWNVNPDKAVLEADDFAQIMPHADDLDIVLFGGGTQMQFLKSAFKEPFHRKKIAVEPMDTGAACRTYNVLLAEGRRVVAALRPVL